MKKTFNAVGVYTLTRRETKRFLKVYIQTIIAPVISTALFYIIFALALGGDTKFIQAVPYLDFIAPGLIMMAIAQNAFANPSSSFVISKMQGNIIDILLAPIGPIEMTISYMLGGIARGLVVGFACYLTILFLHPLQIIHPMYILFYAAMGSAMLALIGIIGGIVADKVDHISAVTSFVIMPLTFLSGTFYSIDKLTPFFQYIAHINPFFFMIDGFRYGFIGVADSDLTYGLIMILSINIVLFIGSVLLLKSGYKLKN